VGEKFTADFGIDPQLQVRRQIVNKQQTTQGGNQMLHYEYRTTPPRCQHRIASLHGN